MTQLWSGDSLDGLRRELGRGAAELEEATGYPPACTVVGQHVARVLAGLGRRPTLLGQPYLRRDLWFWGVIAGMWIWSYPAWLALEGADDRLRESDEEWSRHARRNA